MKKRLVADEQGAISLIQQQIGSGNLQAPGKMSPDEFSKLFSKGQFRTTLINTINKLQEDTTSTEVLPIQRPDANLGSIWTAETSQSAKGSADRPRGPGSKPWPSIPSSAAGDVGSERERVLKRLAEKLKETVAFQQYLDQDARQNFGKEMPLSLRIERFQRQKLLQGLKPERDQEQREQLKYLHSLKYIQRFEPDDIDSTIKYLRGRPYEDFLRDPLGTKYKASLEEERQGTMTDHFSKRIDFVQLEKEVRAGFKDWQDYREREQRQ